MIRTRLRLPFFPHIVPVLHAAPLPALLMVLLPVLLAGLPLASAASAGADHGTAASGSTSVGTEAQSGAPATVTAGTGRALGDGAATKTGALEGPASGRDPSLARGWPVDLGFSSSGYPYTPTLADLDGDGALEVFLVGGNCFGLRGDGTFLPGWPTSEQLYMGYGTNGNLPGPSVADVDLDGEREVYWSTRDWWAGSSRLWTFNLKQVDGTNESGFPQEAPDEQSNALSSPLVSGDIDGDGDLELWTAHTLGNTGDYLRITAVETDGTRRFTRDFGATELVHSPYFGDVDGNGTREIFAVTFRSGTGSGFYLRALQPDGSDQPGFPVQLLALASGSLTEGVPVPTDLDGDGNLEFFLATYNSAASFVHGVHHDGTPLPGFPLQVMTTSQIFFLGLGDLTGDGRPELIVTDKRIAVGGEYRVHAFDLAHGNALLPGWPCILPGWPRGIPVVADIDNDGAKDLVAAVETGAVVAFSRQGNVLAGFPKQMSGVSYSGVATGDIDGDGLLELVAATTDGLAYAWDTEGAALPERVDWPMRGVNAENHGVYVQSGQAEGVTTGGAGSAPLRLLAWPNPMADAATVGFLLPEEATPTLRVFDATGRAVRVLGSGLRAAGPHEIVWDGRDAAGRPLPAGTYVLSLSTGSVAESRRLIILR